jgi:multidrug efflux pump subunit AcrA (membrane-fusion protein)
VPPRPTHAGKLEEVPLVPEVSELLPCRRSELVLSPLGDQGGYVVKDPRARTYYHLGEEEHFLLNQLDGRRDLEAIRSAFAEHFGQPLRAEELDEFLDMARSQGLLQPAAGKQGPGEQASPPSGAPGPAAPVAPLGLHLLYWRRSLFDPDRFFNWLEPRIRFCWTPGFVVFSMACIVLAAGLVWTSRGHLAGSFLDALRWETALWTCLVLAAATLCHEFAHGLTCKHHGGEVHEVGFLLLFFMPCFYCNVSDAWLFKEKSKRLWVTLAGSYFELFLWALSVFVWRLTLPGTLPHSLAFVMVSASGLQTLLNFNPLIKLDGYYLFSDWLGVPNLQQRAGHYLKGQLRRLLWGAPAPTPEPRGAVLLAYGLVSWGYSLVFLALMLVGLTRLAGPRWGVAGVAAVGALGLLSAREVFRGVSAGEVSAMIRFRHRRAVGWALLLAAVAAALFCIPWDDRAAGDFQVRPATRQELRARVAGFIEAVLFDEGDRVQPGSVVVRLEVPDLASRLAQKRAEVREAQARLRLSEAGTRYEELTEQRERVARAKAWRDLAWQDLALERQACEADLARLEKQIAQHAAELRQAQATFARSRSLARTGAASAEELGEVQTRWRVCQAQREQAEAARRARQAKGAREAEMELARRDKELADARSVLTLMEAGSRPEAVEAERARLARLEEELHYLHGLRQLLPLVSPVGGVVTTARLREKVGQYVREGDLIAVVEEPASLEAEITLTEQDVARVHPGQPVALKARALPLETFPAQVDRVAPAAARGDVQGTVVVYCRLEAPGAELRPGMTGHARIATGRRSLGAILFDRGLRYVRTEFWW